MPVKDPGNAGRVFVLGLDGATFDVMLPLIRAGKLPTFAKLLGAGVHARLNSTLLSHSAPAWTSYATGKNPGKHSISGFTQLMPNSYNLKLLNGGDNKARTLWEVLSAKGRRVIVLNVPMTYPPRPVNGLLVSGLDAPGLHANFTHPPELREEIFRVSPDYKINLHLGGYLQSNRRRRQAIRIMLDAIEARRRVVLHLMKQYPWDFFSVRFNSPDNAQHQFWRFMDESHRYYDPHAPDDLKQAIPTIYKKLDETAALILEQLPPGTTLIVMSDHGAGARTNKTVRLNEWLASHGYLSLAERDERARVAAGSRRLVRNAMETGLSLLLRALPAGVKDQIRGRLPRTVSRTWTYFRFPNIRWDRTRAFVGEIEGIRINLQGVFPKGIVTEAEYEPLRAEIIRELAGLVDPSTNEKIFQQVVRREEAFQGPYLKYLPDIFAITVKDQYNISTRVGRNGARRGGQSYIQTEEHWRRISGSHRREGIFMMVGPEVRTDVELPLLEIVDVFPTILYQLGEPVPTDIDGRVLTEVYSPAHTAANPPRYETVTEDGEVAGPRDEIYSDQDYAKLTDHLRGLGYIE
jgi:predicted AlkP superfamily phosphohydrolase/phosphomutase